MDQQKQINIGLQIVSLTDAYNIELINSINTAATKLNANLILFVGGTPGHPNYKREHHQRIIYDHINSDNIDVIITLTPTLKNFVNDDEFLSILNEMSSVPIVSIGLDISPYITNQSSILVDPQRSFTQLIEHLIVDQGHSNLAFISGPLQNPEALIRFEIYKNTLKKHNIEILENNIYYGTFDNIDAVPALNKFLSNSQKPDVIVCSNDICALSVMEELSKRNISVPNQISVTGFDNIDASKTSAPLLTTISQSFLKIGSLATKLAINHALKKACNPIYYSDALFIRRQSCGNKAIQRDHDSIIDELYNLILPKNNKRYTNTSSIYILLTDIITNIVSYCKNDTNQSIVEFEEYYILILTKRIKLDIRNENGYKNWNQAIEQLEDNSLNFKFEIIELLAIRIREILLKEFSLFGETEQSSRKRGHYLKDIIEEISDSKNIEHLSNILRKKSKLFSKYINLENYMILGYPHPIKKDINNKWVPSATIDVLLSFDDIYNNTFKISRNHDETHLFPKHLTPTKKRYTLIIEALYSSDDQLGRVIYELSLSEFELIAYSMISTQIASTLRLIHQNTERALAQNKIDLLVKDLESKKQLAEEAVIAKSRFLATMSHEIRTPMNGVIGVTELLKDTTLNSKQNNYIDIIQNSSNSLLNIISDILDFSKIEEGKLSIEHIQFDLNILCNEVFQVFSFNSKQKDIELKLDIKSDVPKIISSDPTRLRQILINLIGNAFKFTDSGSITLKIESPENTKDNTNSELIKLSIIDTGIGISEKNIEKLFGAFSQADNSITRNFGGTGLGLSISKSLSELMGGDIGVTSKLNSGSTFWFTILSQVDKTYIALPEKQLNTPKDIKLIKEFKGKKILVAEDNKVNQLVIKGMLKKLGINITIVDNGQDAYDAYHTAIEKFDLIIMDFEMPILDGASATKKIRAFEKTTSSHTQSRLNIPIIAITAHAMKEHRDICIESGMNDFLSKPIDQDQLIQILNRNL